MSSCISLTGVKDNLPLTAEPKAKIGDLEVYYNENNSGFCITDEQKMFLRQTIEKYAPFKSSERVEIIINQRLEGNPYVNAFWIGTTLGSLGIIPFMSNSIWDITIANKDQGGAMYRYQYEHKNLISLFALPFMISNSITAAKRSNLEHGIFEALRYDGITSSEDNYLKPVKVCKNIFEQSMPW